VGLYEVPHTKNVMAITKKRFYPRALNVISARLECIRELGPAGTISAWPVAAF